MRNNQYFFDVGRNEVIRINESTFKYLYNLINGTEYDADEETLSTISDLRSYGYLSNKKPEIVEHSYTNFLPIFLDRKISKITLQLTQNCNF